MLVFNRSQIVHADSCKGSTLKVNYNVNNKILLWKNKLSEQCPKLYYIHDPLLDK